MAREEASLSSALFPAKYIMYQTLFSVISYINSFNSQDKSPGRCCSYLHFAEEENEVQKS